MPSPLAHSLIGVSIGVAARAPRGTSWSQLAKWFYRCRGFLFLCVLLANAPDIDYLFGWFAGDINSRHQLITHTLGWVVIVTLVFIIVQRYFLKKTARLSGFLVFALLASHLAADYFGCDLAPPIGFPAFWPLTDRLFLSPVALFPAPDKSIWFSVHNLKVMLSELRLLLPVFLTILLFKVYAKKNRIEFTSDHAENTEKLTTENTKHSESRRAENLTAKVSG